MGRPKRIAVCVAQVPFFRGGAEAHVEGLRDALVRAGHRAEIVAVPFKWYPKAQVVRSALAWRFLNLDRVNDEPIDMAICTKFPSYVLKHPNKVTWIIHQFRQVYDWFNTPLSEFTNSPEDLEIRSQIVELDRRALLESRRIYSNSKNTANRLEKYTGLKAIPLYPPLQREGFRSGPYGEYVLSVGRLDKAKRVDLLLQTLPATPTQMNCVVVGEGPERRKLEELAAQLGVSHRVKFLGYVVDSELIELYANCFAVFFAPLDEDYGYITVEAFRAGKPVVTAVDSGGVLEFVTDGESGLVTEPVAEEMAKALARLFQDRKLCQELGLEGNKRAPQNTWQDVVETLVG
ncbi:MAG: glycosyltransferase family 4 protein [Chloroflexi bacterium]|nr:glycosyltransferase family 4 protein [Chloroflexota bacterium]